MNGEGLVEAFESLQKLERHYKAQYENYIQKALAAKENLERLEVLLKDLCSQLPPYPQEQQSFLEFEPEPETINGSRKQLELDWMSTLVEDTEPNPEPEPSEYQTENQEISHREFVKLSSQVMPILGSIFALDVGKKLHLSYLHKAVNQQSQLGLSQDTVELFLDKAIALGYCERDVYDQQCYYSISDEKNLFGTQILQVTDEDTLEKQQPNQEESVILTEPTHSLPPSPKVKITLADTIGSYLAERQPDTFTIQELLNYLYSETEQKQWSGIQRKQIITSISNSLRGSKQKQWSRIQPGVYQSLLTPPEENSVATTDSPNHTLPPSPKVKKTIPDTILGYIDSCHPKTFKAEDVVNYLYSAQERKQWSKSQRSQITHSITAGLSYYNRRNWKRLRAGVYRPI